MLSYQNQQENEVFQLIEHLRKAFRVEPSKHLLLYEKASERGRPQLKLNLCVLEAKELACKDNLANDDTASKGDPFVTVHLISRHVSLDVQCSERPKPLFWFRSDAETKIETKIGRYIP